MQTIWQRIKTPGGWRYRRIEEGRGKRTSDLQPPFYLRPTISGGQRWHRLHADTFAGAKQEAEQFEAVLEAASKGLTVAEAESISNLNRVTLKAAAETYLDQKSSKAPKTYAQYRLALNEFMEIVGRKIHFLDQITPDVLRAYKRSMEGLGFAGRTIHVRLNVVYFMLKKNNIPVRLPIDEMPTTEDEPAIPYSDEEITKLFAGMKNDDERLLYKFFLGTACRSKEVKFAAWSDLNFDKKTFTVRGKPDVGFTVKNHESRTILLPATLIELLRARKKKHPQERWVFVNRSGSGPGNHFLRRLKEIALNVGLNCGQCKTTITEGKYDHKHQVEVSCKTHAVCEHIYLHRLRKTCATRWQEHGVPVRTIQAWLGHKNLETTMLYLGVTDTGKLAGPVDAAFGD